MSLSVEIILWTLFTFSFSLLECKKKMTYIVKKSSVTVHVHTLRNEKECFALYLNIQFIFLLLCIHPIIIEYLLLCLKFNTIKEMKYIERLNRQHQFILDFVFTSILIHYMKNFEKKSLSIEFAKKSVWPIQPKWPRKQANWLQAWNEHSI